MSSWAKFTIEALELEQKLRQGKRDLVFVEQFIFKATLLNHMNDHG